MSNLEHWNGSRNGTILNYIAKLESFYSYSNHVPVYSETKNHFSRPRYNIIEVTDSSVHNQQYVVQKNK